MFAAYGPTYFTPIVGTILGTTFNNEPLLILSVVGMFVVIIGAYLMSKPEKNSLTSAMKAQ